MSNPTHTSFDRAELAQRVLDALFHPTQTLEEHLVDQAGMLANLGELLRDYADATRYGPIELYAPLVESFGRSVQQHAKVTGCLAETLAGHHKTRNRDHETVTAVERQEV